MSIMYRCTNTKCRNYYSVEHKNCPKCGTKSKNYYISYYVAGKLKFKKGGTTISSAKETEANIILTKDQAANITKIMLYDFVKEVFIPYYNTKNKKGNEKINEQFILAIIDKLPNKWLHDITALDVETYLISLTNQGRAPATRNRHLALLAGMFKYAVKIEYLDNSPIKSEPIKVDNARERYLSSDEKIRLIQECQKSTTKWLYPMVMVALHTGMREDAIKHLKKDWIVDNVIHVPPVYSKSKKAYHIPLTNELKTLLNSMEQFDFNHDVKKSFTTAKKKAGIENFRFHDLRHTFASKLAQSGATEYSISRLLGHSSTAMAKRYSHLSPDSILNVIHKMEESQLAKKCPDCAETIKIEARKCRFCGYVFS